MNPNKALWEQGDFTRIAASMRESGEELVKVAAATATTAVPAARLGADVLGVDIAQNLVEAGNRRAREMGRANCRFQESDATNLYELTDHSFDLVVSIFGAALQQELEDLFNRQNTSPRKGATSIPATFLRVTVAT